MTSVAMIVDARRGLAHLLADGCGRSGGGLNCGNANKVLLVPQANLAIHVRGSYESLHGLAYFVQRTYRSYDELVDRISRPAMPTFPDDYLLHVVGWSDRGGPSACMIASHGPDAGRVRHIRYLFGPPISEELTAVMKAADDPTAFFVRVLEEQRRHADPVAGTLVGNFAQLVTIGHRSITTRVLGTWPDEIGRPLDPGLPFDAWDTGVN